MRAQRQFVILATSILTPVASTPRSDKQTHGAVHPLAFPTGAQSGPALRADPARLSGHRVHRRVGARRK